MEGEGGGGGASGATVYIGGLSFDTTEDSLRNAFRDCGEISGAKVLVLLEAPPRIRVFPSG